MDYGTNSQERDPRYSTAPGEGIIWFNCSEKRVSGKIGLQEPLGGRKVGTKHLLGQNWREHQRRWGDKRVRFFGSMAWWYT